MSPGRTDTDARPAAQPAAAACSCAPATRRLSSRRPRGTGRRGRHGRPGRGSERRHAARQVDLDTDTLPRKGHALRGSHMLGCPVRPKAARCGALTWASQCSSGRPERVLSGLNLRIRRSALARLAWSPPMPAPSRSIVRQRAHVPGRAIREVSADFAGAGQGSGRPAPGIDLPSRGASRLKAAYPRGMRAGPSSGERW